MNLKDNQERPRRESDLVTFRSAKISQFEANILQEIEKLTENDFTKVN